MSEKYRVPKDIWTSNKPNYYKINKHQDLLDLFKDGLLNHQELKGFYKGVIFKYLVRFDKKGETQSDLDKLVMYAKRLRDLYQRG